MLWKAGYLLLQACKCGIHSGGEARGSRVQKHKLLQDVETKWKSTYDMISRVMEQQASICATFIEQKRIDLLQKDKELRLLEGAMVVLKTI